MSQLNWKIVPLLLCSACSGSGAGHGGSVQFTASGEVLALDGYAFPASSPGDPIFVDGWEVRFDELLVTLDAFTLSENPDLSPTDASKTGKAVARVRGPWAIDLHAGGPLSGKGGSDEQAYPIATLENQNLNGGDAFDPTLRYAFGFDVVVASARAKQLNLSEDASADYAKMIERGYAVYYAGSATFRGVNCASSSASADFTHLPTTVRFELGFASPTRYSNCQNPDNDPAQPLGDEEHQRGVQVRDNAHVTAQATIHTDHPFWQSFEHDSPAHFDQLAAHAHANDVDGSALVTSEDLLGVDFTAFKDNAGKPLAWRSCDPSFTPPDSAPNMHFDSRGIPYDPEGDPSESIRDYLEFMTYDQSTQGHLNSDGLCFVKRQYDSPP